MSLDIHLTANIKWCIPYDAQITYKHKRQSFYVDNSISLLVVTWASAVLGSLHTDTGTLPRTSDILLVPKLESLYRDPDFSLIYTLTQRWCQDRCELAFVPLPFEPKLLLWFSGYRIHSVCFFCKLKSCLAEMLYSLKDSLFLPYNAKEISLYPFVSFFS